MTTSSSGLRDSVAEKPPGPGRLTGILASYGLVTLTLVVLGVVGGLMLSGQDSSARWLGSGYALVVGAYVAVGMVRDLLRGNWGVDVLAVTAIVSTVAVGEYLAAMVVVSYVLFLPAVFGNPRSHYRRFLSSAPMRFLGPLTFGIYLWHYPIIRETGNRFDLSLPVLTIWVAAAAPLLAYVTYRLIEHPIDHLRHRRFGRTASPRTEPTVERSTTR